MSNGWCSLYKNVQQTRRHWPLVCTDYWHHHPRHYYMPLTWYGSTSARNVTYKHSDRSNRYLATLTQPLQSQAFLNWIPKPWIVSLKVSNDYASLSDSCTWGAQTVPYDKITWRQKVQTKLHGICKAQMRIPWLVMRWHTCSSTHDTTCSCYMLLLAAGLQI